LTLVRFLHGFTSILVIPVAMALAGDIAPRERLGLYMGTLNMAIMLGLGIGPALGGVIRETFGMDTAFLTMGALTLLTFLGVRVFIPADRYTGGLSKDRRAEPLRTVLRHRVVRGIFLLRLITSSGQGCVYTFLPLLALRIHVTSAQIGLILGVNILLIALLQRPFGALADRVNPIYQVAVGSMISGVSVLLMPGAGGFLELLCFNFIMGIGSGIAMPAGLALSGRVGRRIGLGAVIGVTDAGWSIGMIISPIASGVIMDTLGLPWIFFVGGCLVCLGTALVFVYLKGYHSETDSVSAAIDASP
jgi:MFS family permease